MSFKQLMNKRFNCFTNLTFDSVKLLLSMAGVFFTFVLCPLVFVIWLSTDRNYMVMAMNHLFNEENKEFF